MVSAAEQELTTGEAASSPDRDRGRRCHADAQCVPASCCHPTSCVPRHQAPDCTAVLCSFECRPGTMDCGQGHCECQQGSCVAVIE